MSIKLVQVNSLLRGMCYTRKDIKLINVHFLTSISLFQQHSTNTHTENLWTFLHEESQPEIPSANCYYVCFDDGKSSILSPSILSLPLAGSIKGYRPLMHRQTE